MKGCTWALPITLGACFVTLSPSWAQEERIDEIEQRLDELESLSIDLADKTGQGRLARALDSLDLGIGGYFFAEAVRTTLEGTPSGPGRTAIDSTASGVPSALAYIVIDANLGENWEFELGQAFGYAGGGLDEITPSSTSVDPTNGGNLSVPNFATAGQLRDGSAPLDTLSSGRVTFTVDANIKYNYSDALTLTLGRTRTPLGIINRQFYPLTIYSPYLPLYLRNVSSTGNIYPVIYNGIQASGKSVIGPGLFTYSAFWGNGTNPVTQGTLSERTSASQTGGRISYGTLTQDIEFGLSAINGKRDTVGGRFAGNRYTSFGADFYWNNAYTQLRLEYYKTNEEDNSDREAYYVEPLWHINDHVDLFIRHDYLDVRPYTQNVALPNGATIAVDVPLYPAFGESVENTIGLFISPTHNTRIRLGYASTTYRDQNDYEANKLYASVVASF